MAEPPDPRRIVAEGYDLIAESYAVWASDEIRDEVRPRYTAVLLESLPAGAAVLELGCGGGGLTTKQIAERFALTGVDISERQIELARQNVPRATFIHGDMTRLAFPPSSFDGVAAFYSFTHLPHEELPQVLGRITTWLRPQGVLVVTMSAGPDPGTVESNWLGAPMYFSGYSSEDGKHLVERACLKIVSAQEETIFEAGRPVVFLWVVAKKPVSVERKTRYAAVT
jgi:SAM-dependent methyltransferase